MLGTATISQNAAWLIGPMAKKRDEGPPATVDDGAIGGDLDADAQRVGARQSVGEKRRRQRIGAFLGIARQALAGNDPRDGEGFDGLPTAPAQRDVGALAVRRDGDDFSRDDFKPPAGDHRADAGGHFRRHAMAVDVPPRPCVFEEARPATRRHGAPNRLRMGTKAVDDAAPVATLRRVLARQKPEPTKLRRDVLPERCGVGRDGQGRDGAMGVRQEAASRQGDDPAAVAVLLERQGGIDHRQPGSQDQKRRLARRAAADRFDPRADGERTLVDEALMAAGQYGEIGVKRRPRGERDLDAALSHARAARDIARHRQRAKRLRPGHMLENEAFEISPIETARHKAEPGIAASLAIPSAWRDSQRTK